MEPGPTFQELDRRAAELEAKRIEVIERLSRILAKEFTFQELKFVWGYGGGIPSSIVVQAFENARLEATR